MEPYGHSTCAELIRASYNLQFADDLCQGLAAEHKHILAKYHYDQLGSELFELITKQPEYYLTQAEFQILGRYAADILSSADSDVEVIELGPGSGLKAAALLRNSSSAQLVYKPVDISKKAIDSTVLNFKNLLPKVLCQPLVGDFFDEMGSRTQKQKLILFLGSSIGNFRPAQQHEFLEKVALQANDGDLFLCGFDLIKDEHYLNAAYNDVALVTEQFNFNLLDRANRETGSNFSRANYHRTSSFNSATNAVETYLVSENRHDVFVAANGIRHSISFGESIHIESSYKFTLSEINSLAKRAGFEVLGHFQDRNRLFVDTLMRKRTGKGGVHMSSGKGCSVN